jgi:hypothetical protein
MKLTDREIFRLSTAADRNDFTYILGFFAAMERAHNQPLLKKYGTAVDRVEAEFEKLFRAAAWNPDWSIDVIAAHRVKLVGYIASAGNIKPFIDDMRAVRDAGKIRPRELKYFMFTKGAASRWQLIIDAIYEARWQEKKQSENAGLKRTSSKSTKEIATEFGKTKTLPAREVSLASLFGGGK